MHLLPTRAYKNCIVSDSASKLRKHDSLWPRSSGAPPTPAPLSPRAFLSGEQLVLELFLFQCRGETNCTALFYSNTGFVEESILLKKKENAEMPTVCLCL